MKFGKTIKRIVALGIGASMLGATILGASAAASLNQYPSPFVKNGKLNGILVVGDNAAAEDVIGVSDIAMSLQYAVSGGSTTTPGTTVSNSDTYQFEKSSDKLNLWQQLSTIRGTLTSTDLKTLSDGTFKGKTTETYTQKIDAPENAQVVWEKYTTRSDDPALYLKFGASQKIIKYRLNFQTAPESKVESGDLTDFENNKISILGKEYTVTKAENLSTGVRLTLMGGAVQDTAEVGQTKKYTINGKDYEVTVMVVSGDNTATAKAKLIINDEVTDLLAAGDTDTLKDGTEIGIKEVIPTKAGDAVQNIVEYYIGAQKIVLDGTDNSVDVGDQSNIDGVNTTITSSASSTNVKLSTIQLEFAPSSAYYVGVGSSLSKAADIEGDTDYKLFLDKFGVDYVFNGITTGNKETAKVDRYNDNSMQLTFTNKNGVEYKFPIFYETASAYAFGKESGKELYVKNGDTACRDDMFAVDSGSSDSTSRVLQVVSTKNTSDTKYVKLKDVGTGDTTQYDLASDYTASIDLDGTTYTVTYTGTTDCVVLTDISKESDGKSYLWTKYGSRFELTEGARNTTDTTKFNNTVTRQYDLIFREDKDKQEDNTTRMDEFGWTMAWDAGNEKADISSTITGIAGTGYNGELSMEGTASDSKKTQGYDKWGTFFEVDTTGDQNIVKLTIPEEQAKANVVFATAGAGASLVTTTTSDSTGTTTSTGARIDLGATKLASEIKGMEKTQNLILVGGPCANAAVEAASDKFPTCSAWPYQPGEALIQLVEQADGHVALLVAGSTAADTRTATGVVYDMTKLKAATSNKQKVTVVNGQQVLSAQAETAPTPVPSATPEASATPAASTTE